MQALFWISFFFLFYTYIGYGFLLLLLSAVFRKKTKTVENFFPGVTLLVPAYEEEKIIQQKIENSLQLNYPAGKLSFVFITDGSTDQTPSIVAENQRIRLLHQPLREGKSAAINRAMKEIKTPVVVFTDANSFLHPDSIINLVRHFVDEKVGGVSGEKRIANIDDSGVGFGEKIYWRYESKLKKANAKFHTLVGAAGELFAIRTTLFSPLGENIILDDFMISARICQQGFRVLYEQEAIAIETSSSSMAEEKKRKIRISAGCFQALYLLRGLLNPFRNSKVSFQYISHRVLRWVICPLALPLLFLSNMFLCLEKVHPLYVFFCLGQFAFYAIALAGWIFPEKKTGKILLIPYYAVFMVLCQYLGLYRYITKKQTVFWEKATRK